MVSLRTLFLCNNKSTKWRMAVFFFRCDTNSLSMSYFILFKESDFEIVVVVCCDIHFYSSASLEVHVFSQTVICYVLVRLYKILVFWVMTLCRLL